jgi:hypothetical protein
MKHGQEGVIAGFGWSETVMGTLQAVQDASPLRDVGQKPVHNSKSVSIPQTKDVAAQFVSVNIPNPRPNSNQGSFWMSVTPERC